MVSPAAPSREDPISTPKSSAAVGTSTVKPSNQEQDDRGNSANYEALDLIGSGAYGTVYRSV